MADAVRTGMVVLWCLGLGHEASAATLTEADGQQIILRGVAHTVTVEGATPGARVHLVASAAPPGAAECPPVLAPRCLALSAPAVLLDSEVADGAGVATFRVQTPSAWPVDQVAIQAAIVGSPYVLSNVLPMVVLSPGDDEDGDGVTNRRELRVNRSDLYVADTDGDGWSDRRDLYPLDPTPPDLASPPVVVLSARIHDVDDLEVDPFSNQVTWMTRDGRTVFVGEVDPIAGTATPPDLRGEVAATDVVEFDAFLNGPEWLGDPSGSQVLYTKEIAGEWTIMRSERVGGQWVERQVAPGGAPLSNNGVDGTDGWFSYRTYLPGGGADRLVWTNLADLSTVYDAGARNRLWGLRAVPGRDLGVASVLYPLSPVVVDLFTGDLTILRDSGEPLGTTNAVSAPELGGRLLVASSIGDRWGEETAVDIFVETPAGDFEQEGRFWAPTARPHLRVVRPFVMDGRTWLIFVASPEPGERGGAQMWVTAALTGDATSRLLVRESEDTMKDLELIESSIGTHVMFRRKILGRWQVELVDVHPF